MSPTSTKALDYLKSHRGRFLSDLEAFLRIPSISSDPSHRADMQQAADWAAERLRVAGLDAVALLPTGGHPVVYGEALQGGRGEATILVYGHYDVQTAEPLADWESDPFVPVVRGDNLYARGATDMKGQIMASIAAVESAIRAGTLPVNVKFLIEGEEEIGSSHLAHLVKENTQRLACDFVLNPDAGMPAPDVPAIVYALRGGAKFTLHVTGPAADLHSGTFGGVVHNPIHALSELIVGLHDERGRVALPGFYDSVRPLSDEERAELANLPMGEAYYLERSGAPALWGDPEYIPIERTGMRPTMDVVKIEGGQPKSAIPSKATAYLAARLVPYQDPAEVHQQFRRYLQDHAPATVAWELEYKGGGPAVLTDRNSPAAQAMFRALEETWGTRPVYFPVGGSIPAVRLFQEILGVDSVLTGFALPEDNLHGPNEKLHLPTWKKGAEALVRFFDNMAQV